MYGADSPMLPVLVALPAAAFWQFALVVVPDCVRMRRSALRIFVPEHGVLTMRRAARREANGRAGVVLALVAGALVVHRVTAARPGTWSAALLALCAALLAAALTAEQVLHRHRSTLLCAAVLAAVVTVGEAGVTLGHPVEGAVRMLAMVATAQMYLVSGLRKTWSASFRSGQVLLDELVLSRFQAAAGNPDFVRLVPAKALSRAILSGVAQRICGALAVLAVLTELALGVGVLGVLPAAAVIGLAVATHTCFAALSPRRILPFSLSAVALVALAVGWY
ncbi:hypothetical protein ACFXJO_21550 [Streptomyces lavendulae]|uniref:hypothetical protein n=1 Tax=Streptomyces lavendulae TaxID=1914 RepID=UPI00369C29CC